MAKRAQVSPEYETKLLSLEERTDPTNETNIGHIYVKDVSGVSELFYQDNTNTPLQITKDGNFPTDDMEIEYSPVNYTPSPGTDLASHLDGIDTALGSLTLNVQYGCRIYKSDDTELSITIGVRFSDDFTYRIDLPGLFVKKLKDGSWAEGSGDVCGLDTGSTVDANTWYHVFLINKPSTNTSDILFTQNISSPTMPADYTLKKRIGAVKTDGSKYITDFVQIGKTFLWSSPIKSYSSTPGTSSAFYAELDVPIGIKVKAKIRGAGYEINTIIYVSSPDINDEYSNNANTAPGWSWRPYGLSGVYNLTDLAQIELFTDTSSQIRVRMSSGSYPLHIYTDGWEDPDLEGVLAINV